MAAPPACDIACQKNKRLATLLSTLQEATVHKGTNPEAYEKARMNYYTLKEGQSWLHTEKEKIANNKVTPLLDMYTKQFQTLQTAADKKAAVKQALDDAKAGEVGDEDETRFIHSQIEKEYNKAGVQTRLMELTKSPVPEPSSIPMYFDILMGFLILVIVYLLFGAGKWQTIQNYFSPPSVIPISL